MSEESKKSAIVVHTNDDYSAVINIGSEQGVKHGDIYLIYTLGIELHDPETNSSLGNLEIVRGRARVSHVQEKMSTLDSIEFEETSGKRKIVKRDRLPYLMPLAQKEEIVEDPERRQKELDAEIGDFARLVRSK